MIDKDTLWILSFYRTSEISGALFFGRLARTVRPGAVQGDLTRHFADEAAHARYWTECIERLQAEPLKLDHAYQEQYQVAAGMPANLMEILAITLVFERRVINQYARHLQVPGLAPPIAETLSKIMTDESWHIKWVREALRSMEREYSKESIEATLRRFWEADQKVYQKVVDEHAERIAHAS